MLNRHKLKSVEASSANFRIDPEKVVYLVYSDIEDAGSGCDINSNEFTRIYVATPEGDTEVNVTQQYNLCVTDIVAVTK